MYKVFYDNTDQRFNLFFAIEYQLEYTSNPNEADIIVIDKVKQCKLYTSSTCKFFLVLDLFHGYENGCLEYQTILDEYAKLNCDAQLIILSQYHVLANEHPNVITYDFMFNRSKAYFTNFPIPALFCNHSNVWYWSGELSYQTKQWSRSPEQRNRIFCSHGRTYPTLRPDSIRHTMAEFFKTYNHRGYVGFAESDDNSIVSLYSHREDPLSNGRLVFDIDSGKVLDNTGYGNYPGVASGGFSPLHVNYYENSFISFYGETIEYGNTLFITEKTFVPMAHGHFVLPFSNCGFVNFLKQYGFAFPDFIDYSYDNEKNYQKRKEMYFQECKRLIELPHQYWREQFYKHEDIRFRNKQLIWIKPYDSLITKIKNFS